MKTKIDRRTFLGQAGLSAAAFTIVPRHVLGGPGVVPPSDKITMALIGCGTQGLTELVPLLRHPEIQMTAVCDPNRESTDYVEWGKDSVRRTIAMDLGIPEWRSKAGGAPGGRLVGQEIVNLYYKNVSGRSDYKGCAVYTDFRELLGKANDIDAVKIMTPDHLHATVSIAAMKKGKHVLMHKPLANRVIEARRVIETARETGAATHFLPADAGEQVPVAMKWIRGGAIGTLREIHNWSNRPVWPQYTMLPEDRPKVPDGLDWDLWLGPSQDWPYHPNFTHAVFRGWYEFGGGAVADMGHYSLWRVFRELGLKAPVMVESTPSHACTIRDGVSRRIENDFSFPGASTIHFRFAAGQEFPELDMFWYDGGMKPRIPEEMISENRELRAEGMMFIGDQGKILAGFFGDSPRLIPESRHREYWAGRSDNAYQPSEEEGTPAWIEAFRGGKRTDGDFLLAGPISEAFNLGAISLRQQGARLIWDAANMTISNRPDADQYLTRAYRKGWEIV